MVTLNSGDTPVGELVVVLDGEADQVLLAQKAIENAGVSLQVLKKEPNNGRLDSTKLSRYLSYRYAGVNSWPTLSMRLSTWRLFPSSLGTSWSCWGFFLVLTGSSWSLENKFSKSWIKSLQSSCHFFHHSLGNFERIHLLYRRTNLGMTADFLVPLSFATSPILCVKYRWYLQIILTVALLSKHQLVVQHFRIRLRFTLVKGYLSWFVYQP